MKAVSGATLVVAWTAVLVLLTGCPSSDRRGSDLGQHSDLEFLNGVMIADDDVVVTPDHYWGEHPDKGRWSFRNSASLICYVQREPVGELAFHFKPDEQTSRRHFVPFWNGERLVDRPVQPSLEGSTVVIPRGLVTKGTHRLTLRRDPRMDAAEDRSHHDNGFREVSWSLAGDRRHVRLRDRDRLGFVSDFLTRGLAGASTLQLSGCLFAGGREAHAELVTDAGGSVSLILENESDSPANYSVTVAGRTHSTVVPPRERQSLEVELPAGRQPFSLAVAGDADGNYLWGAPYLRRRSATMSTPIVLITLDTTRRDEVSTYGGNADVTPAIEDFARHATVFDNAHATSPWTLPSHASIFTGLYPSQHGAGVSDDHLANELDTVAELLRRRGYLTAGFAGGALSSTRFGVGQGFSQYRNPEGFETRGDSLTDHALAFLERHAGDPFFMFINYFDPHALYEAPEPFQTRFGVAARRAALHDVPLWGELADGSTVAWRAIISGEARPRREALDYLQAAYRAEVAFMDRQLSRLFEALRKHGVYESALIILVADHGELLGEGGYYSHCCRLEPELTEVPLVIKWPFQSQPRRVTDLVSHIDLFATLLHGGGIPLRDRQPLGETGLAWMTRRSSVVMEEHESRIHPLFANMKIAPHLYGLQQIDRRELVWDGGSSCSGRSAETWVETPCTDTWPQLMARVRDLAGVTGEQSDGARPGVLSDEERARLEALGYVR
jgi:arylsulfatase